MEWSSWLKKETQPTGLTGKKLALWKKIQEDNKEDSDNQYYTKAWEEWLDKQDNVNKILPAIAAGVGRAVSGVASGVGNAAGNAVAGKLSDKPDEEVEKSWELFLEKNNAIETDHKEGEKKHEWDGKFSSSTIRDDVKDEKAMDEESDEIMEDAGLEEIEKLKAWQIFLKSGGGVESARDTVTNPQEVEGSNITVAKLKNPPKRKKGHGVGTPELRDGKKVPREIAQKPSGNKKESLEGKVQYSSGLKIENLDPSHVEESAKLAYQNQFGTSGTASGHLGGTERVKPKKTQKELDEEFFKKSWEIWLEKDALDGKQGIDKLPKADITPILEDAKEVIERDTRGKKNEMYKSWLEKMQGAGDARFGNQHLTGLDQKPVNNEEDEANILPEKDEKHDEKEEKQEKTDNKPYKVLGDER